MSIDDEILFNDDIELITAIFLDAEKSNKDINSSLKNMSNYIKELEEEDKRTVCRLRGIRNSLAKVKKAYYKLKNDSNPFSFN